MLNEAKSAKNVFSWSSQTLWYKQLVWMLELVGFFFAKGDYIVFLFMAVEQKNPIQNRKQDVRGKYIENI